MNAAPNQPHVSSRERTLRDDLETSSALDPTEPAGFDDHAVEDESPCEFTDEPRATHEAMRHVAAPASDEQLARWIEAIVDQDERALASLYDATFLRVYGICSSTTCCSRPVTISSRPRVRGITPRQPTRAS